MEVADTEEVQQPWLSSQDMAAEEVPQQWLPTQDIPAGGPNDCDKSAETAESQPSSAATEGMQPAQLTSEDNTAGGAEESTPQTNLASLMKDLDDDAAIVRHASIGHHPFATSSLEPQRALSSPFTPSP